MTTPTLPVSTPTALDLARLVIAVDDRTNWPASAWSHVDALRTAAHAVLIATGHADELLPDGNEETDTPDALPEDLRDYHPDPAAALARCDPNLSFAVTGRTSVDAHADVAMALLTPDDPTLP